MKHIPSSAGNGPPAHASSHRRTRDDIAAELTVDPYIVDSYLDAGQAADTATPVAKWDPDVQWKSDGLCTQVDNDIFFPDKGGSVKEGKAICAACPVRQPCLDFALRNDERFGIWGGHSERERRQIRQQRRDDTNHQREQASA